MERWWKVLLAWPLRAGRLVSRLVEDTQPQPQGTMGLLLTQTVEGLGIRGDPVTVKKALGRNKPLPQGLAVYPSPENKKVFQAENQTVKFLKNCHLEVGMRNNVKWELNPEIVCRHFFRNLGLVLSPHALKLPEEPVTRWGECWCEVTVNGLDTVRVPMSVVNFERPKTKRYKYRLAQQAAK